ncbi:hypothetical protein KC866_00260 [Patescibacteria group bacterium]|nr:hypothetical protein [Patescibacteria group bacterium]
MKNRILFRYTKIHNFCVGVEYFLFFFVLTSSGPILTFLVSPPLKMTTDGNLFLLFTAHPTILTVVLLSSLAGGLLFGFHPDYHSVLLWRFFKIDISDPDKKEYLKTNVEKEINKIRVSISERAKRMQNYIDQNLAKNKVYEQNRDNPTLPYENREIQRLNDLLKLLS